MNKDMWSTFMKNIDWEKMDTKLMIRQDPVTRANRKKFFLSIDDSGGGALDAKELKNGVQKLLVDTNGESLVPMGDELMPAVTCAFNASRNLETDSKKDGVKKKVAKGKKAKVGIVEFRPFLIAFKNYLQLLELFEFMDGQGEDNQKLSLRECKRGILLLNGWGITEEELEEKFKGVDAWTSHLSFKKFAEWAIEESGALDNLECDDDESDAVVHARSLHTLQKEHGIELRSSGHGVVARDSEENHEMVEQLFAKWDSDKSGCISEEELGAILKELGSGMTDEQLKTLFAQADHNKDGKLDYNEFLKWLLS